MNVETKNKKVLKLIVFDDNNDKNNNNNLKYNKMYEFKFNDL